MATFIAGQCVYTSPAATQTVSNLDQTYASGQDVERYCNAVAAEILVPEQDLRAAWPEANAQPEPLKLLASRFKVSSLVLLRRLRDIGVLTDDGFRARYEAEEARFAASAARQSGDRPGGDRRETCVGV